MRAMQGEIFEGLYEGKCARITQLPLPSSKLLQQHHAYSKPGPGPDNFDELPIPLLKKNTMLILCTW